MILCIGTTPTVQRTMTFATLTLDAVNRAIDLRESASGKSLNVARVVHTLGEQVLATGFLGGDTGQFIREDLDRSGIAHDFGEVRPRTRTCTSVIDRSANTATELIQESNEVEADAWDRLRSKIDSLLPRAKVIVMSGTLTPNAPQDFYAWCVRRANETNVKSIVDATGEPLKLALAAKPTVAKPNRAELSKTLSTSDDLNEMTRAAIAAGARWVVITMGGDGAIVSDGASSWRIPAPRVKVVSPIGSGDAFAAGLAVGIVRGQTIPEASRLGAACGAANAEDAVPGSLSRQRVEALMSQVHSELIPHT